MAVLTQTALVRRVGSTEIRPPPTEGQAPKPDPKTLADTGILERLAERSGVYGVPPTGKTPDFIADASWPQKLPNNWIIGQVGGLYVAPDDHIWIYQRPRTLTNDEAALTEATHKTIYVLKRDTLEELGRLGRSGRETGEFHWLHQVSLDSRGNICTAEVDTGKRLQKFIRYGAAGCERHRTEDSRWGAALASATRFFWIQIRQAGRPDRTRRTTDPRRRPPSLAKRAACDRVSRAAADTPA